MEPTDPVSPPDEREGALSSRVLLVAPSPPPYGGMAIQARLLEKFLIVDGHEVDFFATTVKCPSWLGLVERVPALRTIVHAILIYLTLWRRVRKAEVVHVLAASWVYFFSVVCPSVVYGRINGKRVVLNYRGGDASQFFRWYGWLVKPIFRLAGVVTTPSRFLAESIGERFGVTVSVVPNILDSSNFRYRLRTTIQPKILITRHLEKLYGVEVAIQAFRSVQSHYPDASLWIAGTGSQEEYLRKLVAGWKLRNVSFLGHVEHPELGAVCDKCDILLNASFIDNFPGSLLEASGTGLVVISTAAGGIPFMFQHEKTALLVEPGDWNGLAQAVESVLQSPSLGMSLTREAATLARRWHWTEVRAALYTAYGIKSGAPADCPDLPSGSGF